MLYCEELFILHFGDTYFTLWGHHQFRGNVFILHSGDTSISHCQDIHTSLILGHLLRLHCEDKIIIDCEVTFSSKSVRTQTLHIVGTLYWGTNKTHVCVPFAVDQLFLHCREPCWSSTLTTPFLDPCLLASQGRVTRLDRVLQSEVEALWEQSLFIWCLTEVNRYSLSFCITVLFPPSFIGRLQSLTLVSFVMCFSLVLCFYYLRIMFWHYLPSNKRI